MPQWRKLHVKATESLDINDMPDDFHRLLWVMLPLGLDSEGRGIDNPSWIKSKIMPLRTDVTMEAVSQAMDWYGQRGMIQRYTVDGRRYFFVPTFGAYQGNTSREAASSYPAPSSPTSQEEVETNSGVSQEEVAQQSSTDSDSDVDSETETDSLTGSDEPPPSPPPEKSTKKQAAQAMFSAVAEVCKIDWRVCTDEQRGALNQTEKFLREKASAEPDDLPHFGRWWYAHDWRGKKGEDPEPHQVREEWGRCTNWRINNTPAGEPGEKPPRDPLETWWSQQLQGKYAPLTQFKAALQGARPISRENGTLALVIPNGTLRERLATEPQVLATFLSNLAGVDRLEIVE